MIICALELIWVQQIQFYRRYCQKSLFTPPTLHKISRSNNNAKILNIEDLAINRYTLLGGEDFDLALAKNMFARYLEQFRTRPKIVNKIKREENAVMPQLLNQAEELKIRVSMDHSEEFGNMNAFDNACAIGA